MSAGQKQLAETLKELMILFNVGGKELIFNEIKELNTLHLCSTKLGGRGTLLRILTCVGQH